MYKYILYKINVTVMTFLWHLLT